MYSTLCFQNISYFCLFNEACQTFLTFCTLEICRGSLLSFPAIFQKEGLRVSFTFLFFPKSIESLMHEKLFPMLV